MQLEVAGQVVPDPMALWRSYAKIHGATLQAYDFQPQGDPNVLTAEEAYRSRKISSRMTRAESRELHRRAADAPWEKVPGGASLADADPAAADGLLAGMACFYWHFTWPERIAGVRVAKVHKALHPKRPALFPILDQRLKTLYEPFARDWLSPLSHLGDLSTADSPPYWAAIRHDLILGNDAIEDFRTQLSSEQDQTVRSMIRLTSLRLLDIIGWTLAAETS